MTDKPDTASANGASGDLLDQLGALASPHRMRIVAALRDGRNYVSQLARDIGLSRPLLQIHLRKLEDAGLVSSRLELSSDGRAMKFYELSFTELRVTPATIAAAAAKLPGGDTE